MFKQWKAWFKNKMKTRDDSEFDWSFDMVLVWANYLTDKKITSAEFKAAKQKSFDLDWMPVNAQEFLKLARGEKLSEYPDLQTAFDNACVECGKRNVKQKNWAHDVVRETANRIGWRKLAECEHWFISSFEKTYNQVVAEHQAGATFEVAEDKRLDDKSSEPMDWNSARGQDIKARWAALTGNKAEMT